MIEVFTALTFGILFFKFGLTLEFAYYAVLSIFLISIFVIDLEKMLIPDELVFSGLLIVITYLLIFGSTHIYAYLLTGFVSAVFFLLVTLVTRGKGMGLGDAKLALLLGSIVGPYIALYTFTLSFVVGALVGIFLIMIGKAQLKKPIPFGPFMVLGFFISLILNGIVY